MLDTITDNDDLTPMQEYAIAGGVILLFGLLYWFLNHGESGDTALMSATTRAPQVVMMADESADKATAAVAEENSTVASKPVDAKKVDTNNTVLTAKAAPESAQIASAAPAPDVLVPATNAPKVAATAALNAGPVGSASSGADAGTSIAAAAAPQPTQYTLPDGTQIDIASSRFGLAFRDAIAKRDVKQAIVFDEIKFDSGSSKPNTQSTAQIQQVVALLHANPDIKLLIRGHTDEVGAAKDNTELSLIRANEIGVALVQAGIDRKRLRIMGMGSSEPISIDNTDSARERNRRIDALILK